MDCQKVQSHKRCLHKEWQDKLISLDSQPDKIEEYFAVKQQLEDYDKEKRAGARWREYGEQSTKYFFGLEKRNSVRKTINVLRTREGKLIYKMKDIMQLVKTFHSDLYAKRNA